MKSYKNIKVIIIDYREMISLHYAELLIIALHLVN